MKLQEGGIEFVVASGFIAGDKVELAGVVGEIRECCGGAVGGRESRRLGGDSLIENEFFVAPDAQQPEASGGHGGHGGVFDWCGGLELLDEGGLDGFALTDRFRGRGRLGGAQAVFQAIAGGDLFTGGSDRSAGKFPVSTGR